MKKKPEQNRPDSRFIIGIGGGHREYDIINTRYVVEGRFAEATLTDSGISQIMSEIKGNQKEYLKIEAAPLRRYFPPGTTAKQMQTTMIRAMEFYRQHTQNRADKPKEREER